MTMKFARGKRSFGYCDRCYWQYPSGDLTWQVVDQKSTGAKVCPTCNDQDQPQLQLGKYPINDPVALLNPRPDSNPGRGLFGWAPVGNDATLMVSAVGTAYVKPL